MLGKHVTAMQAVLQTVAPATGLLADSTRGQDSIGLVASTGSSTADPPTIATTAGLVDEIDLRVRKVEENISAVTETHANHVVIALDYELIVTEILRQGANNCLWANLWTAVDATQDLSRIVRVTFARAGNRWTGFLLMQSYPELLRRGKTVGRMRLQMVDPGQANLAYSVGDR